MALHTNSLSAPEHAVAVRTLIAAGFTITNAHRQPRHIELHCFRVDMLGATIRYLVALTQEISFTEIETEDIKHTAMSQGQVPVLIASEASDDWLAWTEFTEALGGAVPSWQALAPTYNSALLIASRNTVPEGQTGEAWLIFEDLVAYGLELVFGRRVHRLGGRKRGKPVSDLQAQTASGDLFVVDAKAALEGFNVNWSELRPMVEYIERQNQRQFGQIGLYGAILVSSDFHQPDSRLRELADQFFAHTRFPLAFLSSKTLARIVDDMRNNTQFRNAINWRRIFISGVVSYETFVKELDAAKLERVTRGG